MKTQTKNTIKGYKFIANRLDVRLANSICLIAPCNERSFTVPGKAEEPDGTSVSISERASFTSPVIKSKMRNALVQIRNWLTFSGTAGNYSQK